MKYLISDIDQALFSPGGGMVDAADLKSVASNSVWVRLPPRAPLLEGVGFLLLHLVLNALTTSLSNRYIGIYPNP